MSDEFFRRIVQSGGAHRRVYAALVVPFQPLEKEPLRPFRLAYIAASARRRLVGAAINSGCPLQVRDPSGFSGVDLRSAQYSPPIILRLVGIDIAAIGPKHENEISGNI